MKITSSSTFNYCSKLKKIKSKKKKYNYKCISFQRTTMMDLSLYIAD